MSTEQGAGTTAFLLMANTTSRFGHGVQDGRIFLQVCAYLSPDTFD
ncbi:hypothetical protein [Kitasatospora sp. NPDC047058]